MRNISQGMKSDRFILGKVLKYDILRTDARPELDPDLPNSTNKEMKIRIQILEYGPLKLTFYQGQGPDLLNVIRNHQGRGVNLPNFAISLG